MGYDFFKDKNVVLARFDNRKMLEKASKLLCERGFSDADLFHEEIGHQISVNVKNREWELKAREILKEAGGRDISVGGYKPSEEIRETIRKAHLDMRDNELNN